jgi:hypothetical protein
VTGPARMAAAGVAALLVLGVSACGGGGGGGDGDDSASRDPDRTSETTAASGDGETTGHGEATGGETAGETTDETVPPVPGEVADPVGLDDTADAGHGVEVRLSRIRAVEAEANLPGEVGGPAVAVTVEVANGSRDRIDLGRVTVDLATREGASASPVVDPDQEPLAGALDAGRTRSGTYVFTLADDERADVSVLVRYSADTPTVVFTGNVPDA